MSKYGLCGEKLAHSYSETIHNMLGNNDYKLLSMTKDEFYNFFSERKFSAVNVTIPYKKDALALCDAVSEEAERIGSVNTVVNKNGKLYGYNTDIFGFIEMAKRAKIDFSDKKVLIFGSGGTSLTAHAASEIMGAGKIITVSRTGKVNYENVSSESDADILINTTPVGMYPNNGSCIIDFDLFPKLSGVIDVVYNPHTTEFVRRAKVRGIPCTSGLYMLVAQAVKAHELFFDTTIEKRDDVIADIYKKCRNAMMNIILVGMPGSGKSTVGKLIANITGREFFDSDDIITQTEKRSPAEIIKNCGEEEFRKIESEVIKELSKKSASVIATGGGAVIKEENRTAMRQNSNVVFIERSINELATESRPLSDGGNALEKLFLQREAYYREVSDFISENKKDALECAEYIVNKLL